MRSQSLRARKVEAVPSKKEVEGRNVDHAVFRSWRPRCVKVRAEAHGRGKRAGETRDAPAVSLDYTHAHSEQGKKEEKGMPTIVVKDNKTKMVMAKVVSSKGMQEYAVASARRFVGSNQDTTGRSRRVTTQRAGNFCTEGDGQERRAWRLP